MWRYSGLRSLHRRTRILSSRPHFTVARELLAKESVIADELLAVQGEPADLGGSTDPIQPRPSR